MNYKHSEKTKEKIHNARIKQIFSLESIIKRSNSMKLKWSDPSFKKKMCALQKGRIITEETKKKISLANKGRISSRKGKTYEEIYGKQETIAQKKKRGLAISKALKGVKRRPASKEFLEYLHLSRLGHIVTEETKEKIRKANLGKKRTEETKKKISNALTKRIMNGYFPNNPANFKHGIYDSKNNGNIYYRSSWELACMQYFDKNNIEWIYEGEKNRFFLSSINKYYVNDFYLPKENKYVQVKGKINLNDKFFIFQKEYNNIFSELWDLDILKQKGIL